ncbi:MAG: hypothetical protein KDN19_15295 [Verrucomicrobiae bacterium]|nr:hypothetical protein [Verrucomicrobiae bacterium]
MNAETALVELARDICAYYGTPDHIEQWKERIRRCPGVIPYVSNLIRHQNTAPSWIPISEWLIDETEGGFTRFFQRQMEEMGIPIPDDPFEFVDRIPGLLATRQAAMFAYEYDCKRGDEESLPTVSAFEDSVYHNPEYWAVAKSVGNRMTMGNRSRSSPDPNESPATKALWQFDVLIENFGLSPELALKTSANAIVTATSTGDSEFFVKLGKMIENHRRNNGRRNQGRKRCQNPVSDREFVTSTWLPFQLWKLEDREISNKLVSVATNLGYKTSPSRQSIRDAINAAPPLRRARQ